MIDFIQKALSSRISFGWTNESLEAIMAGLEPTDGDSVLSVGGSGDQAFALLENAATVYVVDNSKSQLDYIRRRTRLLANGNFRRFLEDPKTLGSCSLFNTGVSEKVKKERNSYFSRERLGRIRAKVENLRVLGPMELTRAIRFMPGLTRLYLSNALEYGKKLQEFSADSALRSIARNLQPGSLIYVSNHDDLERKHGEFNRNHRWYSPIQPFLPPTLAIDQELTQKARDYQAGRWHPGVYRRI